MSDHYRAFVAVLALTLFAQFALRWLLRGTSMYEGFERRRTYWLGAVAISFLVPDFYLAMFVLGLFYLWAVRKDPNPAAFYLMFLLVMPPIQREIGGIGPFSKLFDINNTRLMALVILAPLAMRMFTAPKPKGPPVSLAPRLIDVAAILMASYLVLIYAPQESVTALMRNAVHQSLDFLLPYFVISRFCTSRERVMDCLGALLAGSLIICFLAVFEHFKGWLLFTTISVTWGVPDPLSLYLMRDSALRASASSGHALVLGHLLVVCVGLMGFFRTQFTSKLKLALVWAVLLLGLYSTVSRGPWVAAAVVMILAGLFTQKVLKFYAVLAVTASVIAGGLLMSPWADKLINFLPFIGKVDQGNVEYRQQLLDAAFMMVRQNPVFGNVRVLEQLEHLRQGQGIIDMVNVYAEVAMTYGLVGLFLFCVFLFGSTLYAVAAALKVRKQQPDLFVMIGNSAAALMGSMITLVGISNYLSVPLVYTSLVALLVASVRVSRRPTPKTEPATTRLSAERGPLTSAT
jgi:O-antigen ligase